MSLVNASSYTKSLAASSTPLLVHDFFMVSETLVIVLLLLSPPLLPDEGEAVSVSGFIFISYLFLNNIELAHLS